MDLFNFTKREFGYFLYMYNLLKNGIKENRDFPAMIELQTINRCNAKCPMCPYSYTTALKNFQNIDSELFDNILIQLSQEKDFKILVLTFQNEPLLDKELVSRAIKFKNLMPEKRIEIVTNGSLLNKNIVPEIYKHFDTVTISINAHDEKTYKEVMGGLSWKITKENLEFISSRLEWVNKTILRFIKQTTNHNEYREFKHFWNKKGFIVFGFDINSRLEAVKEFDSLKIPDTISKRVRMSMLKMLSKVLIPTCPIPFLSFFIRVNGDVVLCFNDWTDDNLFGNVKLNTIREIFNTNKYRNIRVQAIKYNILDNDICKKCDLYKEGVWLTI